METEHGYGMINNSYIIRFKDDVDMSVVGNHLNFVAQAHAADRLAGEDTGLRHVYDSTIKGYSGSFTSSVVEQIRSMPEVDYVERDQIVRTQDTELGAPWGLARISHRAPLTLATLTKYLYDPQGGAGVDVYVIDTGINVDHVEFEGRAFWGKTIPKNDEDVDANGHGTHCAGTIASRKYGVAKAAHVHAVKVLGSNGSGSMSDVVAGVEWALKAALAKAEAADTEYAATGKTSHKGSVANMSLGGGKSRALDDTVNRAVKRGLHFAVAAGNDNKDACNYSPAAAQEAVTVGASTLSDERAYFSNTGACVDVFAPGLNILSTWIGSRYATNKISGTSMASPHTAGMIAYLLGIYPSKSFDPLLGAEELITPLPLTSYSFVHSVLPSWITSFLPSAQVVEEMIAPTKRPASLTPTQMKKALLALSSEGLLADVGKESPNLLIFNNYTSV
jgi:cerevisin